MAEFLEVRCEVCEKIACVVVPATSSIGDVITAAVTETRAADFGRASIWLWNVCLNPGDPLVDYFEPDTTYSIKFLSPFPDGGLLSQSAKRLESFGIDLSHATLLLEKASGRFVMDDFDAKVVSPGISPTLVLVEWDGGVCGGVAGVSWPPEYDGGGDDLKADPDKTSFIFSLTAKADRRYELVDPRFALGRWRSDYRGFSFGAHLWPDLSVYDDGTCQSCGWKVYAGPRADDEFPGDVGDEPFLRFEIWAL
jgi:hypothetical protein